MFNQFKPGKDKRDETKTPPPDSVEDMNLASELEKLYIQKEVAALKKVELWKELADIQEKYDQCKLKVQAAHDDEKELLDEIGALTNIMDALSIDAKIEQPSHQRPTKKR